MYCLRGFHMQQASHDSLCSRSWLLRGPAFREKRQQPNAAKCNFLAPHMIAILSAQKQTSARSVFSSISAAPWLHMVARHGTLSGLKAHTDKIHFESQNSKPLRKQGQGGSIIPPGVTLKV